MTGLYIHIPFCVSRCSYCDFCSYTSRDFFPYVKALTNELNLRAARSNEKIKIGTVYFGGGTPTLLPEEAFEEIFDSINENYDVGKNAEITVECNPASANKTKLKKLAGLGANRFSVGLQCANDVILSKLMRPHNTSDFRATVEATQDIGITNISADIMLGVPGQTVGDIDNSLRLIFAYSLPHVSAYALKVERGTPLFGQVRRGEVIIPDGDKIADMYGYVKDALSAAGLERYEISNFAKKGHESLHNLNYWRMGDYIGAGCSAHGYFCGKRYSNIKDLNKYIARLTENRLPAVWSKIESPADEMFDFVMLGLRLDAGLSKKEFFRRFGKKFSAAYPKSAALTKKGVLIEDGDTVKMPEKYSYAMNSVLTELLFD